MNEKYEQRMAGPLALMALLALGALFWLPSPAQAADLTWNNGFGNNSWNTGDPNWTGSSWNNGTPDAAYFASDVGTVTLTEAITAAKTVSRASPAVAVQPWRSSTVGAPARPSGGPVS